MHYAKCIRISNDSGVRLIRFQVLTKVTRHSIMMTLSQLIHFYFNFNSKFSKQRLPTTLMVVIVTKTSSLSCSYISLKPFRSIAYTYCPFSSKQDLRSFRALALAPCLTWPSGSTPPSCPTPWPWLASSSPPSPAPP